MEAAARIASGALLLIEDGVLSAVNGSPARELLQRLIDEGVSVFALQEDLEARGLKGVFMLEGIRTVDYDGFVGLVERYEVVPWL
jgi:tRNA 2-thiouridine synthesizing protein B